MQDVKAMPPEMRIMITDPVEALDQFWSGILVY